MPSCRRVCDHEHDGCLQLLSNRLHYLDINCFQKHKSIFYCCFFVLYCLIVAEPYYGVVPYLSSEVQVNLFSFSFIRCYFDLLRSFWTQSFGCN